MNCTFFDSYGDGIGPNASAAGGVATTAVVVAAVGSLPSRLFAAVPAARARGELAARATVAASRVTAVLLDVFFKGDVRDVEADGVRENQLLVVLGLLQEELQRGRHRGALLFLLPRALLHGGELHDRGIREERDGADVHPAREPGIGLEAGKRPLALEEAV